MVIILHRQRYGYDVLIHTNDHPPPHVHVRKGNQHVRVYLYTLRITMNYGFSNRELRKIRQLIRDNHGAIIFEWERIHGKIM
ncbi:MAG: DUF4160 domain-containing protein [Chloroflexi bacterium]|nr:DUF4160 domain-containing protein [Chloroflexota bacterium]MXX50276.1 DUF4160 domain-containing protein [Chloroflexota bacterium]MXX84590.1 DUF4160 domain-containing protein [Chloroflexota bacterium]MYA93085.1 DUF4160 domain-containing protein [Chloroflexota bacterium]MYC55773.1 DUF4160 domain-containing protein [Chloroflexota bacterium]